MTQVLAFAQLVLALAMVYSCFCRLTKTDHNTHREIRWCFVFEGACAGMLAGAPFLPLMMPREVHWQPGTTPTWIWLAFALSVWLVQVVTARYWHTGVPQAFQRTHTAPAAPLGWFAAPVVLLFAVFVGSSQVRAQAEAPQPDEKWQPVDSDIAYLPQGGEAQCRTASGCVVFTAEALRQVLRKANGTCGRIPRT